MINVLHVGDKLTLGDSTIHGVTRLLSWWVPRFDKSRFNVKVCSLRGKDQGSVFLEEQGIIVLYLNRSKFNPLILHGLLQIIKSENIDILHLHGYASTTFGRICGLLSKTPCIVHEHMFDENIPIYQRFADICTSKLCQKAVAVSESVKDFLIQYRAIPKEKIEVIYNGAPLLELKDGLSNNNPEGRKNVKNQYDIPEIHKLVGIVGRLHEIKGHRYFLEAARLVLDQFKNVTFLVIGDGALLDSLQLQCKGLNLQDNVIFTGYCDEIHSILCDVDIKVISSLSEGVPLTLFEAMAAGCAIVSSSVGGLTEVIKDGEIGFLVPSKSPKELAEKILLLLKNKELCDKFKKVAIKTSTKFDIKCTVNQIQKCYLELQ